MPEVACLITKSASYGSDCAAAAMVALVMAPNHVGGVENKKANCPRERRLIVQCEAERVSL
jgi:hypothetical protein